MSRWDPSPDEILDARPYDYEGAKRAIARASRDQTEAEKLRASAAKDHAEAEKAYRMALAQKITEVHSNGAAWTVAQDLARGDQHVAHLRYLRDVADGMRSAAEQRSWQASANRRALEQLVSWSRAVAPDGQTEERPARMARAA